MSRRRLVADVGGSNVRFALAGRSGALEQVLSYRVADFASFADALGAYRAALGGRQNVSACAIAAAGPVDGKIVKLTNNSWSIDGAAISAALSGMPVALINDLEAVATALPHLEAGDLDAIGGPACVRPELRTMLALNVGTGFGAASAVHRGGQWWTCPSEAGHMTLGAAGADEMDLLPRQASIESLLSGSGVAELYMRLARADCRSNERADDAARVFARSDRDTAAARVVDLVTTVLGRIAGDLALATSAWGGVYLCGSVAVGWSTVADAERFRGEFTRKGPMRSRMLQVPTAVILRENVSLFGLAMMTIPD